jgi:hypothetical protein
MGLSRRKYATRRGVSEKAVRKAIAAGRISVEADGTIDPVKADRQWAAQTDPAMQRGQSAQTATRPVPKSALRAVDDTLRDAGALYERREGYQLGHVPAGVLVLTAGADGGVCTGVDCREVGGGVNAFRTCYKTSDRTKSCPRFCNRNHVSKRNSPPYRYSISARANAASFGRPFLIRSIRNSDRVNGGLS